MKVRGMYWDQMLAYSATDLLLN